MTIYTFSHYYSLIIVDPGLFYYHPPPISVDFEHFYYSILTILQTARFTTNDIMKNIDNEITNYNFCLSTHYGIALLYLAFTRNQSRTDIIQ